MCSCNEEDDSEPACNSWEESIIVPNGIGTWDISFTKKCQSILNKYNTQYNGYQNLIYENGSEINTQISVNISNHSASNYRTLSLIENDIEIEFLEQTSGNFNIPRQTIYGSFINQHNNLINAYITYEGSGNMTEHFHVWQNGLIDSSLISYKISLNSVIEYYNTFSSITFNSN